MYPPKGLSDGYDLDAQTPGTLPIIRLLFTSSNSGVMTTSPATALLRLNKDVFTTSINLLNLINS